MQHLASSYIHPGLWIANASQVFNSPLLLLAGCHFRSSGTKQVAQLDSSLSEGRGGGRGNVTLTLMLTP